MTKTLLAGIAAFAMMTGAALAQDSSSYSSQTTTSTPAPVTGSYHSSETQKTMDSNGVQTDKTKSYSAGDNGTAASSSSQTTAPDGSQLNTYHEERAAAPTGDSSTTTSTTIEH
jgi:hypothetical protein